MSSYNGQITSRQFALNISLKFYFPDYKDLHQVKKKSVSEIYKLCDWYIAKGNLFSHLKEWEQVIRSIYVYLQRWAGVPLIAAHLKSRRRREFWCNEARCKLKIHAAARTDNPGIFFTMWRVSSFVWNARFIISKIKLCFLCVFDA